MVAGYPPFCAEKPEEVYRKIVNHEKTLSFADLYISDELKHLIRGIFKCFFFFFLKKKLLYLFYFQLAPGLLCEKSKRLTIDEIREHPWFIGVHWDHLRIQVRGKQIFKKKKKKKKKG